LDLFDPKILTAATGGALMLVGALVLIFLLRNRRTHEELSRVQKQLARSESQTKEQSRMISRLRAEKGSVAQLALSLPTVVQELNRTDMDPRRVPGLIMNLVESIFQPGQVLFYAARAGAKDGSRPPELRLVHHFGFGDVPEELKRVPFGRGKLGWVAEHRIDMLREDWLNPSRTDSRKIEDNHPSLRAEVVGPLVHHSMDGEQVLGVISIGNPATRPRDEKLMFQLITNLGSLALVNANLMSRLRERANTDGLTGLLAKRFFMDELVARMIVAAEREAQPLGLFIFDLDHFKNYNDTNGHPAGDELLRSLGDLLRRELRPGDRCCRYGGEEFVIAMPDTSREDTYRGAERIRAAIEAHPFPHQEKQPNGNVTISGGVAGLPHDGNSVADLIRHADSALYESKRRGRNCITLYHGVDIGDAGDVSGFDLISVSDE
jgi:diguanylate cyclase (GGDEF)-like protein